MIRIVCSALITKDDKVLLVQENKVDKLGIPGGKLENGESLKQCVARELKEELGAEIAITSLVMVSEKPLTHEGNTVLRYIYSADIISMTDDREMTYGYYDRSQVAAIVAEGRLRGKDVESLLEAFFTSKLEALPEPSIFA